MKLLDTNILVELFTTTDNFLYYSKDNAISRISYIEFLSWNEFSDEDINTLKQILEVKFSILEINNEVADLAAEIRRNSKTSLGDALILATALEYKLELDTNDLTLMKKYKYLST